MDYFKFKRFIKNFLIALWFIFLILLALFLIFVTEVKAETIIDDRTDTEYTFPDVPTSEFNAEKYVVFKSSNNYFLFSFSNSNVDTFSILYNAGNKNVAWLSSGSYSTGTNYVYSCTNSIDWVQYTNVYPSSTSNPFAVDYGWYNPDNLIYAKGVDVKYRNGTSIASSSDFTVVPSFIAPSLFPNASSETSQQEALTSGQFTFFIVNPGSLTPDDTILLNFYNTTYSDSQFDVVGSYELNRDSAFFQWTNVAQTEFQYVLTARFLDWFKIVNGQSYKAQLSFFNNNIDESVYYTWTMSLTTSQEQIERDTTQQEINSGISNINNFLNDDNYDDSMFDLPHFDFESSAITDAGNLYNIIVNGFTDNESLNFEFEIPFSNGQKIIIPANYIENHLPQVIIVLIRVFYWYFICRFIFKDIMKYIDKLRQGDYFMSSEDDIRTEVL